MMHMLMITGLVAAAEYSILPRHQSFYKKEIELELMPPTRAASAWRSFHFVLRFLRIVSRAALIERELIRRI